MNDFYSLKYQDENAAMAGILDFISHIHYDSKRIEQQATVFIETIRARHNDVKGFNTLMQSYDLTSEEGLALMTLAEALLRVPDIATANALITDKLSDGDWSKLFEQASTITGTLSGFGLSLSQKIMDSMIGKIGMPFIRKACVEAMQLMGRTFVLGRDINEAIKNAKPSMAKGYVFNFDILGEGARTMQDADYYFEAYKNAIREIGIQIPAPHQTVFKHSGISIKLSALYPRYEFSKYDNARRVLGERLSELCIIAAEYRLNLTVDAEECDRLSLSLDIIQDIIKHPVCETWNGFGFAVQAYHKRAMAVIDKAIDWAQKYDRKIAIRLVKGAYWDSEIKHAQLEGLEGYPVFTRKENTDASYLACAKKLLDNRHIIYPLLGTHNAYTAAAIIDLAGNDKTGFMFQRLHGMGEQLCDQILSMEIPTCIYAPVGTHKFLLAYLVRRLLENGANSSFVNKVYDKKTSIDSLTENPIEKVRANLGNHAHPKIVLPDALFSNRRNSKGLDLNDNVPLTSLYKTINTSDERVYNAPCIIDGQPVSNGLKCPNENPANRHDIIGDVYYASADNIAAAYDILAVGFQKWNQTSAETRATALEKIANLYEDNRDKIMALLIREAGKTIPDAIAELREAIDFCRYYAVQARTLCCPQILEGPTGELNTLSVEGRGIYACISPWNFPLAIFTGQIVAALVCGNAVIAKPAEQTPAIATLAVKLMLQAGIPNDVIALLHGDGTVGSMIIDAPNLAGVTFTGSTQVAKIIQRQLANKDGAIIPLIAETGGLNAMIVDSTALPEQVCDDVIHSAFGSAGQRCSALRILCVQDDVADDIIKMIKGAMDYLTVGDPVHLSTDIGPIIDAEAKANLSHYRNQLEGTAIDFAVAPYDERLDGYGSFFAPVMAVMDDIDLINVEAFGPILHIVKYKEKDLSALIQKINQKGFGLTFGLHTRIHARQDDIATSVNAGNIYINRGQTGAIVGVQPFGGRGLSGTGPKAGGPHYLNAFITEKSISNNITASGGNVTLVNL